MSLIIRSGRSKSKGLNVWKHSKHFLTTRLTIRNRFERTIFDDVGFGSGHNVGVVG